MTLTAHPDKDVLIDWWLILWWQWDIRVHWLCFQREV